MDSVLAWVAISVCAATIASIWNISNKIDRAEKHLADIAWLLRRQQGIDL